MKALINTLIIIIIAHIVLNNLEVDDKIENYEMDISEIDKIKFYVKKIEFGLLISTMKNSLL